ncbi:MAG: HAD-IC family P-type ATPase, partial [Lentisphaeria bacterium]
MNYYSKSIDDTIIALQSSSNGLSCEQVKVCAEKYGKNCFSKVAKKTLWQRLKKVLKEPMIKLLIATIFLTIIINLIKTFQKAPTNWEESIGITLAVFLSCLITVIMESRSQKAFESLQVLGNRHLVTVLRDGQPMSVDKEDIYPGDIVFINTGDKIPADGRIIQCNELEVNESMLTGESEAVYKQTNTLENSPNLSLGQCKNMVFSGTFVVLGSGKFIITATGDSSEMGKIAHSIQLDYNESTPLQLQLAKFGKKLALIGITIAS